MMIFLLLLTPSIHPLIYVSASSLIVLFFSRKHLTLNRAFIAALLLVIALMFFSMIRSLFLGLDARDYYELGRFLPILALLAGRKYVQTLTPQSFIRALTAYLIANTAFVLAQFLLVNQTLPAHPRLLAALGLFTSQEHIQNALLVANRYSGALPGPSQQGLMMTFIFIISVSIAGANKNKFAAITAIWAACLMVLAQSQTAFLSFTATAGFLGIKLFIAARPQVKMLISIAVLVALSLALFASDILSSTFAYLASLFQQGILRNSMLNRTDKWIAVIDLFNEHKVWQVLGYGKSYFGDLSRAMDSELLFLITVYGALPTVLLYGFLAKALFSRIEPLPENRYVIPAYECLVIVAFVSGIASSFFLDMKILVLFTIVTLIKFFPDDGIKRV